MALIISLLICSVLLFIIAANNDPWISTELQYRKKTLVTFKKMIRIGKSISTASLAVWKDLELIDKNSDKLIMHILEKAKYYSLDENDNHILEVLSAGILQDVLEGLNKMTLKLNEIIELDFKVDYKKIEKYNGMSDQEIASCLADRDFVRNTAEVKNIADYIRKI